MGAPAGTVWNPDSSLTGGVVWVCPSGDTLELRFLGSAPPADGVAATGRLQTWLGASAASRPSSPLSEPNQASRKATLERSGSLLSLMTSAAPVDGGASVGAKEQVSATRAGVGVRVRVRVRLRVRFRVRV